MHAAARWVWLAGLAALSCSQGSSSSGEESVRRTTAALTGPELSALAFEDASQWQVAVGPATLAQSDLHSQGQHSLAVSNFGYAQVRHVVPLAKDGALPPTVVGYDVRIPQEQLNPYWLGDTQLYISAPSVGIYNQYLGYRSFQEFPLAQFERVEYAIPPAIQAALQDNYTDLTFTIVLNATQGNGTYHLDHFTLGPSTGVCTPQNDNNPCTLDVCDSGTGQTTHTPAVGASCADSNPCNGAEVCDDSGTCQPSTPPSFDDGDPCTVDSCDPTAGITHTPVAAGTSCADSNVCNGTETCNAAGQCSSGTPLALDDGNPCTADSCDPSTGVSHVAVAAGTSCSDGNACNGDETCNAAGACVAGASPEVDDGNPCTADTCDPTQGVVHVAVSVGTSCADSNPCNGEETCDGSGACVAGAPPNVDDGNPCTADSCGPSGVAHVPVAAGTACGDGNACNGTEVCNGTGTCVAQPVPGLDDGNPCTVDSCDPVHGVTHVAVAAGTSCSDGNACNGAETCDGSGSCTLGQAPTVDDGNPCTTDSCEPSTGVVHVAVAAGVSCSDGNACNGAEVCDGAGTCAVGSELGVDDGNPCTADSCDPVHGVSHEPVAAGTICAEVGLCHSAGTCDASGTCQIGQQIETDDGNPCTTDYCDPVFGVRHDPRPVGSTCNDGNVCNGAELCDGAGHCDAGGALDVDDGNPCTIDSCDPEVGAVHTVAEDGSACSDDDACTLVDVCQAGICVGSDPVFCGPGDACEEAPTCNPLTGACVGEPKADGTSCDDGQFCTTGDSCQAGVCAGGPPPQLDEQPCRVGRCDPETGTVVYDLLPAGTGCDLDACMSGTCSDDGECIASGAVSTDDGDPTTIDRCDPVAGPIHVPAGAIDPTVGTTVKGATEWIYSGDNPIQTGVAPGTIEARRAALLRGSVKNRDGQPIPGVVVKVHNHPELGETTTHSNGTFDLVVNGGGFMQVTFAKPGYLESSRQLDVQWNHTHEVPEVVLIPSDPVVTTIDLDAGGTEYQVASGSVVTDDDGTRQGTLLFPPGVQAVMHMADGSLQLMEQMNVRITEFTVGDMGPAAMPATLPRNTGYTYAFEVNADEAVAVGAPEVEFSEPLVFYTDNFLHFPAGTVVPLGSFDRERGVWVPHPNGVVLQIVGQSGGLALIDLTGDGVGEAGAELAAAGITDAERARLANLYEMGTSLWRVRLPHFTQPYDCNWPFHYPDDACWPGEKCDGSGGSGGGGGSGGSGGSGGTGGADEDDFEPDDEDNDLPDPCKLENASTLECERQVFRESVEIAGTPFSLNYSSDRVPGRRGAYSLKIPLSREQVPASLKRIDVTVEVAGRTFDFSRPPTPQGFMRFEWDGLDAYGRVLQGRQNATVHLRYVYDGVYGRATNFGREGDGHFPPGLSGDKARGELYAERTWSTPLGRWISVDLGLGGWSLNAHHTYLAQSRQLLLGDGTTVDATTLPHFVKNLGGEYGLQIVDGVDARQSSFPTATRVAVAPDGAIVVAQSFQIRTILPDGIAQTIAGNGVRPIGVAGDGGPAIAAQVATYDISISPDGSVAFSEGGGCVGSSCRYFIRVIGPDRIINRLAGQGSGPGFSGDGGPAIDAKLFRPKGLEYAPDGSLYIADYGNGRVRRVDVNGIITTVAGSGRPTGGGPSFPSDGSKALDAKLSPVAVTFDRSGALLILDEAKNPSATGGVIGMRIYSVGADGLIRRVAGRGNTLLPTVEPLNDEPAVEAVFWAGDITVSPQGGIYLTGSRFAASGNNSGRVLRIQNGMLHTLYGGASAYRTGTLGSQVTLGGGVGIDFGPNGPVVAVDNKVSRFEFGPPGLDGLAHIIASANGSELFVFDELGRHLRTMSATTFATLLTFEYDAGGRLSGMADAFGKTTRIERDSGGQPVAIVGPYGHRTTLSVNTAGYLTSVVDPQDGQYAMTYVGGGLLSTFENPNGGFSSATYDTVGRITVDEDAAGAPMSLSPAAEISDGWRVTRSTALGRTTTYEVAEHADGSTLRTNTLPDGTKAVTTRLSSGQIVVVDPSGTQVTTTQSADPIWGADHPVYSTVTRLPSGLQNVQSNSRSASLTNPLDYLTLSSFTDTTVANGRTSRTVFTKQTGTFQTTSAANRITRRVIDALGRTTRTEVTGILPVDFIYDSDGRLQRTTQGTRTTQYGYFGSGQANGYLQSVTDALGVPTTMTRDAVGRTLTETRGVATTGFGWDSLSNLTSVTPPGQPEHLMSYTPVNQLASYAPPELDSSTWSTTYNWDLDRKLTHEFRPDGVNIEHLYDDAGRLTHTIAPTGVLERTYYPPGTIGGGAAPGKLATLSGPGDVMLTFGYDGRLKTSESWDGDVNGDILWTYNNNFVPVTETVVGPFGSRSTFFGYDNDLLMTCASPTSCSPVSADALKITHHAQHGMVTALAQGGLTETWTYNTYGELATQQVNAGSSPVIAFQYATTAKPRDQLGRIVEKAETFAGTTKHIGYTYDVMGRLTDVTIDGAFSEHYEYDLNGNRLLGQTLAGSSTGEYDEQDRLLSYGNFEYTYTANGELRTKTDTSTGDVTAYTYDAFGSLVAVELPDGRLIEYVTDGRGRRVAKKVDGVVTKQWLYRDQLEPVAELDGAGNVVATFAYGSRSHVPDYMVRADGIFRVVSDQVGSVRMVVNVNNAADVRFRAEYSAFGEMTVLSGSVDAAGFGFAGGVFDADTGLTRFGARDYDPEVGRWTNKDPIRFMSGDGGNLYVYAGSDPTNVTDPSGLSWSDMSPQCQMDSITVFAQCGSAAAYCFLMSSLTDRQCQLMMADCARANQDFRAACMPEEPSPEPRGCEGAGGQSSCDDNAGGTCGGG